MNVSDAKFDDGEWVSFEMIMWEGGGGDDGALYTDMDDANGSFYGPRPGSHTNVVDVPPESIRSAASGGWFIWSHALTRAFGMCT